MVALRVGQLLWREVIVDKRTDPPYYAGSYGLVYELRSGPTADPHYARGFIGKNRRPCSDIYPLARSGPAGVYFFFIDSTFKTTTRTESIGIFLHRQ